MAVFYNKERAKYGHITGQVIVWPVSYEGTPDSAINKNNLPAGYLKCDGSKYFASDYPRLAAILGTGTNTAFMKKNLDGTDFETINDNQFMVPDLGSKYPEPTSGANAGVYNNIRKNDELGVEKSRSGIGIDAEAAIGTLMFKLHIVEVSMFHLKKLKLKENQVGHMQVQLTIQR